MKNKILNYGLCLLALGLFSNAVIGQEIKEKPNVLLIMADEHPFFLNGCYGNTKIKTPNINKLAKEGVVFDAAYCGSPICAPSRASMMTGRHVHTHEVWDNAAPLRSDWPTFAHSFSLAGYRTILCGKMHFVGPDQFHGFSERWTQDIYPATFDWSNSNREDLYVNRGQNVDKVLEAGPGRTPDMDYDEEVLFRTKYGLRYLERMEEHKPFMLCVSFTGPHYPFHAPQKYWDMYSDEDIELPNFPKGFMENESDYNQWARTHGKFEELVPDSILRKARHSIMARTTLIDDYIGEIIDLLKELDLYDNTIIVYTSDHGEMFGEHGLWYKNTALEASSRVPLIFSGKSVPGNRRVSEPVSLLDMGPTLCGLVGIDMIYPITDGRNISDLIENKRQSGEGIAIMENYGEGAKKGYRMIRKGKYKLVYVPEGDVDLFDLEKDPQEWNDLASDPKYKKVVQELTVIALDGWQDYKRYDEMRYRSEERRIAIKQLPKPNWDYPSPSVPHPTRGQGLKKE